MKDKRSKKSHFSMRHLNLAKGRYKSQNLRDILESKKELTSSKKSKNKLNKSDKHPISLFSGDRLNRNRSISLLDLKLLGLLHAPQPKKKTIKPQIKIERKWNEIIIPLSIQKKVYEIWEELGDCVAFLYTGSKAHNVKKKDKIKTLLVRYYKNNFSDYNRQKVLDRLVNIRITEETYAQRSKLANSLKNIMIKNETLLRDEFNAISQKINSLNKYQTNAKNKFIFPMSITKTNCDHIDEEMSPSVINDYVLKKFANLEKSKLNTDRELLLNLQKGVSDPSDLKIINTNKEQKHQNIIDQNKNKKKKKKKRKRQNRKKAESKFIYEADFFEEIKFSDLSESSGNKANKFSFVPMGLTKEKEFGHVSIMNESNIQDILSRQPLSEQTSFSILEEHPNFSLNRALGYFGIENDQESILKTQIFK